VGLEVRGSPPVAGSAQLTADLEELEAERLDPLKRSVERGLIG
jgi:hypothetical protein